MTEKSTYQLLMVRFWNEENGSDPFWRCRVKNVRTGQEVGFVTPEAFLEFLEDQIQTHSETIAPKRKTK